jgi:hypothetical protein
MTAKTGTYREPRSPAHGADRPEAASPTTTPARSACRKQVARKQRSCVSVRVIMHKPTLGCAVFILACCCSFTARADWYADVPMHGPQRWTPVGVALVDPAGLWGANDQVFGLSLNGLFGISNDVVGLELSGIGSLVKRSFVGLQLAGIINASARMKGAQLAAIVNLTQAGEGLQIAPANIAQESFAGAQIALLNVSRGNFVGLQLGLMNRNHMWLDCNAERLDCNSEPIRRDRTDGASVSGLQIGMANMQSNFDGGLQLAFANVTRFHSRGVSIGIANLAKSVHGVQLGFINITESLHGMQLGFINVATRERLPFMVIANANWH